MINKKNLYVRYAKKILFITCAATIASCSKISILEPSICDQIFYEEMRFKWVDSSTAASELGENECQFLVTTRQPYTTIEHLKGKDIVQEFTLTASYTPFKDGQFTYTKSYESIDTRTEDGKKVSKAELIKIANRLDEFYGDNDMCYGYLHAIINDEMTGTGQRACDIPPQFSALRN